MTGTRIFRIVGNIGESNENRFFAIQVPNIGIPYIRFKTIHERKFSTCWKLAFMNGLESYIRYSNIWNLYGKKSIFIAFAYISNNSENSGAGHTLLHHCDIGCLYFTGMYGNRNPILNHGTQWAHKGGCFYRGLYLPRLVR